MKLTYSLIAIFILLFLFIAFYPLYQSKVEQPTYNLVKLEGKIEHRQYDPYILATVKVTGERDEALNKGFSELVNYIGGHNTNASQDSENISMTAPVNQQKVDDKTWTVHFVMPKKHTMDSLPKPLSDKITFKQLPEKSYVVIRFAGRHNDENLDSHLKDLREHIKQEGLTAVGEPIYSFYNPPWTLPILRRNEIWLEVK